MSNDFYKEIFSKNLVRFMEESELSAVDIARKVSVSKATVSDWVHGNKLPRMDKVDALCRILHVSRRQLLERENIYISNPILASDVVEIPVIGELAAGYDRIAYEDWTGDTIQIPSSYLKGRKIDEFIVLSVKGDSMYPLYQNGDKVLILRQDCLPRSGSVGAVLYGDEFSTLKKVEFRENHVRLVPLNPMYKPIDLDGEDLASFHILGIPKLLIREIEETDF